MCVPSSVAHQSPGHYGRGVTQHKQAKLASCVVLRPSPTVLWAQIKCAGMVAEAHGSPHQYSRALINDM